MENGESVETLTVIGLSDKLHNLVIKLEYLINAHYGFLSSDAFVITERDCMGFSDVFDGLLSEFKTLEKGLKPHTKTLWELEKASTNS